MSYIMRQMARLALPAAIALSPSVAFAWVETEIKSYGATVELEPDGRATVAHQLVLAVRGGPLKSFEVPGVDADAEPLPDATVTPTVQGAASLPLLLERRDDGVLLLEVDYEKGLRTGRYAFAFRYRTELGKRGLIQRRGTHAELRWVSPHFDQGIDSMRVVFRLPPSSTAPALPSLDGDDSEAPFGAFIANLRRTPDRDELEIVRPHVARGEPVVWRADISTTLAPDEHAAETRTLPVAVSAERQPDKPVLRRLTWWSIAAAAAFAYGLLVWLKSRAFARAAELAGSSARALAPLPLGLRAPLSGLLVAGAVLSALPLGQPTVGALLLLGALVCAALQSPPARIAARGPGRWLPLNEHEVFAKIGARRPGRLLDASSLPGFLLFACGLGTSVAAALFLLRRSPYEALLALLASSVLLPIFCTGRALDLPAHPLAHARLLAALSRLLKRRPATKIVPWARVGDLDGKPDELRLLVQPKPCPPGLVALELGVESLRGLGGAVASPYLLVRVKEGAGLERRLPRSAVWVRGRKPDERVSILRPALPSAKSCLALTFETLAALDPGAAKSQPRSRASSAGKLERTSKLGRVASPAHAT
ncbi:MAG TPA: hypothetical protein VGP93_08180 [Polyangiaceae bacterium]|nr:hypothetical protein [Polyangiaceae bacterium]